jgi:protein TonB
MAVIMHASLAALAAASGRDGLAAPRPRSTSVTQLIDIEHPSEPAQRMPAQSENANAPTPPRVPPRRPKLAAMPPFPASATRPAATPAQAARVLGATDDVAEFSETLIRGRGRTFSAGATVVDSRAARARDRTDTAGAEQRRQDADASRGPGLAAGANWDCPFPEEADEREIAHAVVTLRVDVAANGGIDAVAIVSDPGAGFGREARRCALRKRWSPGRDRSGRALTASVLVHVKFDRDPATN